MKNRRFLVWLGALIVIKAMLLVAACTSSQPGSAGADDPQAAVPQLSELDIITAEQWKDSYPYVYDSYMKNADKTSNPSYLTQYPFLVTIYNGMGFAKDYNEARGHVYTLQDIKATARAHETANCLTCKSPAMNALVNAKGTDIYRLPFDDIYSQLTEPVSCYNCHENKAGELMVIAGYLKDALGTDIDNVKPGYKVCGQCHIEYYFDPDTKATTLPWNGVTEMNPDAMLAYYNAIGYFDFTNSISGAKMIKVQHPEFETVQGAGSLAVTACRATCVDCHTGTAINDAGKAFTSHVWISPLENTNLMETKCKSCHTDLSSTIAKIQTETEGRLVTIGQRLADLHIKIGEAAKSGATEAQLAELRSLVRDAQFYFDFVFVENSRGAHNSTMTDILLNKSERIINEAFALL